MMECYLQEVESTTYFNEVSDECGARILEALAVFPSLLRHVRNLKACKIPEQLWFCYLSRQVP